MTNDEGFLAGVALGGIGVQSDIKLLITYLMKKLEMPLSRMKMCEILTENGMANYFEINQAITELLADEALYITEDDGELLALSTRAFVQISELEKMLPVSLKKKALSTATKIINRDKFESQTKIEVHDAKDGYIVSFEIENEGETLFGIKLFTTDKSKIELMKHNFCDNAASIYSDLYATLTLEI